VRRQVATIAAIVVAGLVAAVVAAVVATATTLPGAIAYSGTASSSNPAVKPPYIVFSGDSSHLFAGARSVRTKIHWTSWTATGAVATGAAMWIDNCDPACADGRFYGYPVTLELSRPGHLGGHLIFTRLKFTFSRRTTPGYGHGETWSADEFDHIYGWG
jgi:hypothetical protein